MSVIFVVPKSSYLLIMDVKLNFLKAIISLFLRLAFKLS